MTFEQMRDELEAVVGALPKRDIVNHFLSLFSRFEYALKENGFSRGGEDGVSAHWGDFANALENLRDAPPEALRRAIEYFDAQPPQLQILRNGVLDWRDTQLVNKNNDELLILVRRVRNNLFHGGKMPFDPMRDSKLLKAAEMILIGALRLPAADNVRRTFVRRDAVATR